MLANKNEIVRVSPFISFHYIIFFIGLRLFSLAVVTQDFFLLPKYADKMANCFRSKDSTEPCRRDYDWKVCVILSPWENLIGSTNQKFKRTNEIAFILWQDIKVGNKEEEKKENRKLFMPSKYFKTAFLCWASAVFSSFTSLSFYFPIMDSIELTFLYTLPFYCSSLSRESKLEGGKKKFFLFCPLKDLTTHTHNFPISNIYLANYASHVEEVHFKNSKWGFSLNTKKRFVHYIAIIVY